VAAYALSISKRRFRFTLAGARAAARHADRYASDRQNLLADKWETRSAPLAEMPGRDVDERRRAGEHALGTRWLELKIKVHGKPESRRA